MSGSTRGVMRRSVAAISTLVVLGTVVGVDPPMPASAGLMPVPLGLTGTLHVSLVEKAWNSDSGHFGGFSTSASLAVLFIHSASGLLTLRDTTGSFKSFVLMQTVPGTTGTCNASYYFDVHSISGDIGRFSGSASREVATVDLGFDALAKSVEANGCGPSLGATGDPFGKPARISIPTQSTGTFAHGDLLLRSTSKERIAGGSLVINIDGTLG